MRIWAHRYQLIPRRRLSGISREGPREGALLRFDDGFADLHPWPELGDPTLDEQLAWLARGEMTRQLRASYALAAIDGEARRKGLSLFDGLVIPESHWPGADPPAGFDTVKTKGFVETPPGVRIRIDFNCQLEAGELIGIAPSLPRQRIDFVEDPCPYDGREWQRIREVTGLRLAYDHPGIDSPPDRGASFDVLVHKPATDAVWPAHDDVVVTSYMDHPLGQFGAAYVAATHRVNGRCGLMTHVLYEPDAFIDRVRCDGARLVPPEGTGIGFDDLLEGLPWKSIG